MRASTILEPRSYRGATGVSTAFGTFGELLQGALPEADGDFLVTLPIARWSIATFRTDPESPTVRVRPEGKRKALRLARMILDEAGETCGGLLTIDSGIPEGKGLASSSADLVATARAVGNALGLAMPARRVEDLLGRIEPTDGVLYQSIVAFYHRRVRLRSVLGSLPPMAVVGIDEGGMVDTVAFNRIPKPFTAADRREYAGMLDRMTAAVRAGDLRAVGEVATRSAEMNQVLRPKRTLAALRRICAEVGGLGVVNAHSGTTLGVLIDTREPDSRERVAEAAKRCLGLAGNVTVYRSLSFEGRPSLVEDHRAR
ncbi:GHMP family kinase ATP-binding protein [Actinokineospora iranica]|uniref:Threonine kinase n=1 Tax=Actinokineospora iranica TaxID=1271860 RepID=A0A1G6U510_9PSEU|nr:kinase [Actinokineospora iranica]SDD36448.1 threonine kinase [Actinokineospora iranica]